MELPSSPIYLQLFFVRLIGIYQPTTLTQRICSTLPRITNTIKELYQQHLKFLAFCSILLVFQKDIQLLFISYFCHFT